MRDMLEIRGEVHSKTRLHRVYQCPLVNRSVLTVIVATGRRRETGVELVAAARIHLASTSPCTLEVVSIAKGVETGHIISYQLYYTRGNDEPIFFTQRSAPVERR